MKYDTVIFDLDGTLLDTLEDLTDSVNAVLLKKEYPLRNREEIRNFIGDGYRLLITRSLPEGMGNEEIDLCTDIFRKEYFRKMFNNTKPYKGILEILVKLKGKGIKIGVVSNKKDEATKEICKSFFGQYIDVVVGDNPERRKKPAPDNVFEALMQLSSCKENTIYVGDSDVDVKTAKNAGITFIGVTWGFRSKEILIKEGADYFIDKPGQLMDFLIQIG